MKKKFLSIALIASLVINISGCNTDTEAPEVTTEENSTITTTEINVTEATFIAENTSSEKTKGSWAAVPPWELEPQDTTVTEPFEFSSYLLGGFSEKEYYSRNYTNSGSGYVREDVAFDHDGVYDESKGGYCQIPSKWGAMTSTQTIRYEETAMSGYHASPSMVYSEHCFASRWREGDMFWISKPISIEEGEKLNALNPLLWEIYKFGRTQSDKFDSIALPKSAIIVNGEAMGDIFPNVLACNIRCTIFMNDNECYYLMTDGIPCSNITDISADENTLIISANKTVKHIGGRIYLKSGFSVVEATVNGDKLTVTFKYFSDENVNSENYNSYTPDETVTSEYTK